MHSPSQLPLPTIHTHRHLFSGVYYLSLVHAEFLEEKSGPISLYDQYGFKTTLIYLSVSYTLELHPCATLLMNIKPLQENQRNFTNSHVQFHPTRDTNELVFGRGEAHYYYFKRSDLRHIATTYIFIRNVKI